MEGAAGYHLTESISPLSVDALRLFTLLHAAEMRRAGYPFPNRWLILRRVLTHFPGPTKRRNRLKRYR